MAIIAFIYWTAAYFAFFLPLILRDAGPCYPGCYRDGMWFSAAYFLVLGIVCVIVWTIDRKFRLTHRKI